MCAALTRFSPSIATTFLVDARELKNSRNSSWLMHQSLNNSQWLIANANEPVVLPPHSVLLFVDEQSQAIDSYLAEGGRIANLVIPDGTWSQAKAIRRQYAHLPCVHLSGQYLGVNQRRKSVSPNHLCTLEAVTAALVEAGESSALLDYAAQLMSMYNQLEQH